jgi:hypothetical protein
MNIFKLLVSGFVVSALTLVPVSTARADDDDDDWEDRWEDYQEELEDRREEQRERWEEWREDREEALEDWREDRRRVRHPAWRPRVVQPRIVERQYWEEELPPPRPPLGYGSYDERQPAYRSDYYWEEPEEYVVEEPQVYEYEYPPVYEYEVRRPEYRYYGTSGIGYTEYGRERSVQVGPFRVYWTR